MPPENEVTYSELPPVPNLFEHPAPGIPGAEMFNEAPPFDSLPDPIPPGYGDGYALSASVAPPYNDDPLMRNREDNMFSIVYDPENNGSNAAVKYCAGIIVEGKNVIPIGGTPGILDTVRSGERAPLNANITWYLNIQSTRELSYVSSTKDSNADLSIPLARTVAGRNGYIQQLHRGAVFLPATSFGFEVQINYNENGERIGIKVRSGQVMLNGSYLGLYPETIDPEGWYYSSFTQDGPVYLRLSLDDHSTITGAAIEYEPAAIKPYTLMIDSAGKEEPPFVYSFQLANITNNKVVQYLLGTVQIPVAGGTLFPYGPV